MLLTLLLSAVRLSLPAAVHTTAVAVAATATENRKYLQDLHPRVLRYKDPQQVTATPYTTFLPVEEHPKRRAAAMKRTAAATSLLLLASSSGASAFVQGTAGRHLPSSASTRSPATEAAESAFSCSASVRRGHDLGNAAAAAALLSTTAGRRRPSAEVSFAGGRGGLLGVS